MRRRGLSTVVGATFFVIAAATIITYVSYSMDLLDTYAQNVITKQTTDLDRINEKFEITKVTADNNKFNMTVKNSGNVPITLSRLWIEDLDVADSTTRNEISYTISPGQIKYNIGQNINYAASDSSPYNLKLVTERGTNQEYSVNSASQNPVFMQISATPTLVPSGFTATITYQVVNDLSSANVLLNLQPVISTSGNAIAVLESGPTPSTHSSLSKGDVATFRWVYNISGDEDTYTTFNTTLANAIEGNFVTDTVTIKVPEFSTGSAIAFETETAQVTGGFASEDINANILLFHEEANGTPNGEYQMFSADSDGGSNGERVELDVKDGSFFTNTTPQLITVYGGDWTPSLRLQSEAMPSNLVGEGENMIFHFEDGDSTGPENSEGDSSRDLQKCGTGGGGGTVYAQTITNGNNDAEEKNNGDMLLTSNDLDMPNNGGQSDYIVGLRFTNLQIPQGTTIDEAYIIFQADEDDSGDLDLKIKAESHNNAPIFTTADENISDRERTSAEVTWNEIPDWTNGEYGADTTTPDLKTIVQEVINRPGWQSGNSLVIIIEGSDNEERVAESVEGNGNAPTLTIKWNGGGGGVSTDYPDWQDNSGPHQSGSFYFDGQNDCFESTNNVSSSDGNDISDEPDTTALWFKTDGTVSSEQYLVYWSGDDGCTECNNYRIALDTQGKVLFEFETETGSGDITTCKSANSYDDSNWYHIVAVREGSGSADECTLYISNENGNDAETPINQNNNYGSNNVLTDGKWYVGTNKQVNGKWFKGWMDDVIHWNDKALSSTEADALSKTNYGDTAHKLNLYIDKTDQNGVLVENIDSKLNVEVPFYDSKGLGNDDDSTYGVFNFTLPQPEINVTTNERINFRIEYVDSTSNWEALEVDMKIDDETMTPYASYLQIPMPSSAFPAYITYDPSDDELIFDVKNILDEGHWLTYFLTRVVFEDLNDSTIAYAAMTDKINGTDVDHTQDSIYIPVNGTAEIDFFKPKNPPEQSDSATNVIVDGYYDASIYIQGYDDSGQMFLNTKYLGSVTVED